MKNINRLFAGCMFMLFLTSCFQHYYKTNTESAVNKEQIEKLITEKKYLILHTSDSAVALVNPIAGTENLQASYGYLPAEHTKNLNPKTNRANRMNKKTSATTLSEVHLYAHHTLDSIVKSGDLNYGTIKRIDVYTFDKSATSSSTVVSIIGICVGVLGILVVAIAASGTYVP